MLQRITAEWLDVAEAHCRAYPDEGSDYLPLLEVFRRGAAKDEKVAASVLRKTLRVARELARQCGCAGCRELELKMAPFIEAVRSSEGTTYFD